MRTTRLGQGWWKKRNAVDRSVGRSTKWRNSSGLRLSPMDSISHRVHWAHQSLSSDLGYAVPRHWPHMLHPFCPHRLATHGQALRGPLWRAGAPARCASALSSHATSASPPSPCSSVRIFSTMAHGTQCARRHVLHHTCRPRASKRARSFFAVLHLMRCSGLAIAVSKADARCSSSISVLLAAGAGLVFFIMPGDSIAAAQIVDGVQF